MRKLRLGRILGILVITLYITLSGCGEMTGDSGGKISSAGSDVKEPTMTTGTTGTTSAKLEIDTTPPKTPGQKDAMLATIYTDDGMKTTFWGTKDSTGLVTSVTQSQTWSDDPTKGFRVSYDRLNRPVQLYSMATGYSTRLVYGDKKITCLFYDNSGQYLGGSVLTLNDSTGEVTTAYVTYQTYNGTLSDGRTMSISTFFPPTTAPVILASKAKRAGVVDALIKAPQYIDAFQKLWETDPDFKYDVLTFPIKNAGTILGTLALNTVGTGHAAKVLGIATEGLTLEALTNKYIGNQLWDAALSAGAKMNEAITSLKARITKGEDVEADGSLSSSVTTQPTTVAYNSQTNWQTQNTPAPVLINNGSANLATIPAIIDNSNKISGSTSSDGSTASISGDWSWNDLVSAGCAVAYSVFENGKSSTSCITWANGTGDTTTTTGGDTTTTTGGNTTIAYPKGCYLVDDMGFKNSYGYTLDFPRNLNHFLVTDSGEINSIDLEWSNYATSTIINANITPEGNLSLTYVSIEVYGGGSITHEVAYTGHLRQPSESVVGYTSLFDSPAFLGEAVLTYTYTNTEGKESTGSYSSKWAADPSYLAACKNNKILVTH